MKLVNRICSDFTKLSPPKVRAPLEKDRINLFQAIISVFVMLDTLVMVRLHVLILMNVLLVITIAPLLVESARILLVIMNATVVLTATPVTVSYAMMSMNVSLVVLVRSIALR